METQLGRIHLARRFYSRNSLIFIFRQNLKRRLICSRGFSLDMSKRVAPPSDERGKEKAARDQSPSGSGIAEADLGRIVSEAVAAQLPRLILETSKVVSEQMEAERGDSSRPFTSFSLEMKKMKQRQEEIVIQSKAAALKSDGKKKK